MAGETIRCLPDKQIDAALCPGRSAIGLGPFGIRPTGRSVINGGYGRFWAMKPEIPAKNSDSRVIRLVFRCFCALIVQKNTFYGFCVSRAVVGALVRGVLTGIRIWGVVGHFWLRLTGGRPPGVTRRGIGGMTRRVTGRAGCNSGYVIMLWQSTHAPPAARPAGGAWGACSNSQFGKGVDK